MKRRNPFGSGTIRRTCFRWVKPAASLKLGERRLRGGRVVGFRWVKPAASLKRR